MTEALENVMYVCGIVTLSCMRCGVLCQSRLLHYSVCVSHVRVPPTCRTRWTTFMQKALSLVGTTPTCWYPFVARCCVQSALRFCAGYGTVRTYLPHAGIFRCGTASAGLDAACRTARCVTRRNTNGSCPPPCKKVTEMVGRLAYEHPFFRDIRTRVSIVFAFVLECTVPRTCPD